MGSTPQFMAAKKAVDRADGLVSEYRNSYGSHVEHDFASTRDRVDDADTIPFEFSDKGLAPRTASAVVMIALLKEANDPSKREAEFARLIKQISETSLQAIIAADLAIHFYLLSKLNPSTSRRS